MKKKVLFMTLAAAVVLTACGGNASSEGADVETAVTEEAEAESEETEASDEEAEAVENEDAAETEEAAEETEAEETEGYAKGTVIENGWESAHLGLRFTAPEGMTMSTEEELNQVMGLGEDVLSEDFSELALEYAKMATVYEMMSTDELGTTNVIMTAEQLPTASIDAEAYADAIRQNLASISQMTYTVSEENEIVTLGGTDFIKIASTVDYSGVSMYQDYYISIIGDRAVSIAVTYIDDTAELAGQIVDGFAAY